MLTGLGIGLLAVWLSNVRDFELFSTHWILRSFFNNLPLIIIVLFQSEIRKALTQLGKGPFFSNIPKYAETELIEELVRTCISLANKKIGALIVIERKADLTNFLETGIVLDAKVSRELITSVFLPISPIHDGAIIIRKGKISKAGSFLPLTIDPKISKTYGTRHRAAIGLTEEVDAVVIVISEEKGTVTVAVGGKISKPLDSIALRKMITELLNPPKAIMKDRGKEELSSEVMAE